MKKSAIVLFIAAFLSVSAMAQSVQEGMNHLYAQRYASAKSVFDKLIAANPNNIDAIYWLGQNYISQKNFTDAATLYQKAISSNGNAPLIMVGMGHVELMQGKANEARAHFESAINASKGKKGNDPAVLNAIGRANVQAFTFDNKLGDLDYAISKLTEASTLSTNNPDIFLNLGNAYFKKGNKGGDAVQAYRQATQASPNFAPALYRTAMLFKTQTSYRSDPSTWTVVLDNLNAAIAADPKFAPAYMEKYFYDLLTKSDFSAAQADADQYVSASDPSPENDYLRMQTFIVQKKYTDAVGIGKNIITQTNDKAKPIVYRAMTVALLGAKDTANACDYSNRFFQKASDEDLLGTDYILKAQACAKNDPSAMRAIMMQGINTEKDPVKKIKMVNEALDEAKSSGQQVFIAELRMISYQLRMDYSTNKPSPTELIAYMAVPFYLGGAYQRADSISQVYSKLAPDSIYGYYWSARAKQAMDTGANMKGSFVPDYQKVLDIANTDTLRYQTQGTAAAISLAIYYVNVKKDVATALDYIEKGLKFDAANTSLNTFKKQLTPSRGTPNPPKTPTPPAKEKVKETATGTKTKTKG